MREQINRLAKGIIEYEQAALVLPKEIRQTFSERDSGAGELRVFREDMRELKGVIYSSNPRVSLAEESFYGRECRIAYRVDAAPAQDTAELTGEFTLVTNCGEASVPYTFIRLPENVPLQQMGTLEEFAGLARQDTLEALRLFDSPAFGQMPFMRQLRVRTLYDGLRFRGNHLLALEEFLVGCGMKEEVRLRTDETERTYHGINESIEDSFVIEKNTWGTVRIELSAEGGFITLPQTSLTEEDFTDNCVKVRFRVEREQLHRGVNRGCIYVKNIRGNFTVPVTADCARTGVQENSHESAAEYVRFVRTAIRYLAVETDSGSEAQAGRDRMLQEMNVSLTRLRGTRRQSDRLELFHAAVQLAMGRRQQASVLLEDLYDRVCAARVEELGNYCFYLYLRSLLEEDKDRERQLILLLNKFYEEKTDRDMLLWLLLRTDRLLRENPALAMGKLRERFGEGSRNPFLLIEGAKRLAAGPEMLGNTVDDFMCQLLWTCVRYRVMTPELSQLAGRAATAGKYWNEAMFRILEGFYGEYPTDECLEGICSLLIKGEKKGAKAFAWYEKGVEADVRLTRLYEYYLYALPEGYGRRLPQIVLRYFSYHHALNRRAQEVLYSNLLEFCRDDEEIMAVYREQIESFALDQMFQGMMDDRLGEIYRYAVYPEMIDDKTARVLPRLLLAKKISCDNPQISQLVLCYEELEDEQIVPLEDGKAYVPVYTDNCLILQQDLYGNRYASLPCTSADFFRDEKLLAACIARNPDYDMLAIRTCSRIMSGAENGRITGENLLAVLRRENLRPLYVQQLQSQVVAGCCGTEETDSSMYLLSLDPVLLKRSEQIAVTETFIRRGDYRDAYNWLCTWGHEGVSPEALLTLCRAILREKAFVPDQRLMCLCVICMENGCYEPAVLEYLCRRYNGPSGRMLRLLRLAQEEKCGLYDLPERLLGQMLFCGHYEGLDEVFFAYSSGGPADESLVRAYLVTKSFLYFTADEPVSKEVFAYLEELTMSRSVRNGMPNVCLMALSKYYSTKDDLDGSQIGLCQEIVEELYRQGLVFAYYQTLSRFIRLPGDLSGKLLLEYRGRKNSTVRLRMHISGSGEDQIEEIIPHMYEGYFVKAATVFVGETVEYEIYDSEKGSVPVKSGRVTKTGPADAEDNSRGGQLNRILALLDGDKEKLRQSLERYGAEDTLAGQLFNLR